MNKTVSINLGGLFFHIDENAYQKLNHYFDAIRRSLSPDGKDEIMNDIEGRIAELLTEKMKNDKQVVGIKEVEEVIAVMGQPEDYRIEDDENAAPKSTYTQYEYTYPRSRKFYRDGDKAIIAGVCAGIAHYFRIDPLWIRILFIISPFISFGTSLIVYVLLWILIPKAITTTEKLEMTGEPINISNIERKVKEEFEAISARIQNVDYEKLGANAENLGNRAGNVFVKIFKGIAKVIGALLTIFAAVALGGLIIAFITSLFTLTTPGNIWFPYAEGINYTNVPLWVISLLGLLSVGIPLFALFLLGLKILVENSRTIGQMSRYTLLVLWLGSLGALGYIGIMQAGEVSEQGKTILKQELPIAITDTLNVKFRYNDYFAKSVYSNNTFKFTEDEEGNAIMYSNSILFYVLKTDESKPYVHIEKTASGHSVSEARKRAEKIRYNFDFKDNTLVLDNYLLTDSSNRYRKQNVEVYLYLPEGYMIKPDSSVKEYDDTDNDFFDLWFESDNFVYKMGSNHVDCLNCFEYGEAAEINEINVDTSIHAKDGDTVKSADINLKIKTN
ncbi:PspC domain-containing protein [Flavobacterium sp. MK4S-17]|uniref:PspC domain-containing protein n=1 Tax=Flavobacterium sp. MK4S-17 TaxID=2543737 RepID=UPI0013580F5D|nr:PspC domain-containing protein [Flavobacterium sp. MK4S-17]